MRFHMMKHAAAALALVLLAVPLSANPAGALQAGDGAPDFTLRDTAGKEVSLESLRGKVVLLSFWECYTDACFTTVDAIEKMLRKYHREDFAAITVCYELPPALAADNFKVLLEKCSVGQVILLDPARRVRDLYEVRQGPTTFLIGRDLVIREMVVGVPGLRSADFDQRVGGLVAQPAGTYRIPVPPRE